MQDHSILGTLLQNDFKEEEVRMGYQDIRISETAHAFEDRKTECVMAPLKTGVPKRILKLVFARR